MREKWRMDEVGSGVSIEENKVVAFGRSTQTLLSFRIHHGGVVGIHGQFSEMEDEEGFAKAEKNLELGRPYPFEPETGKGSRDLTERELADRELLDISRECLAWLVKRYPQFIFTGSFSQRKCTDHWVNEAGMDFFHRDCAVTVGIGFKHRDSKDIMDGSFDFSLRDFDKKVFFRMADDYLANFERLIPLPEEVVIDMPYYDLLGILSHSLDAENLILGTSLLTGKVGERVFSEDFSLVDDVTKEESWFNAFWDGDGCLRKNERLTLIDRGVVITGYADKRNAAKYGVPHTMSAHADYMDIPSAGCLNLRIPQSKRKVKELLDGRLSVIPVLMSGGGFNEKGDYIMPVHSSLLFDGENVLGKLPPFTIVSSMYDMFGKDFLGVGADKPIYHDRQILFKARAEKMV